MRGKLLLALLCCFQLGCASSEKITLSAGPDQQAIVRDGSPALVSQKKNLVMMQVMLKDNTVMPGEWYGGSIVLDPPVQADNGTSSYSIVVDFAGEQHTFAVSQVKS